MVDKSLLERLPTHFLCLEVIMGVHCNSDCLDSLLKTFTGRIPLSTKQKGESRCIFELLCYIRDH